MGTFVPLMTFIPGKKSKSRSYNFQFLNQSYFGWKQSGEKIVA